MVRIHLLFLIVVAANVNHAAAFFKPKQDAETPVTKRSLTAGDLALAGGIATVIGDVALHPIDCIKTLQQSDAGAGLSLVGAGRKILADSGAGGFYSGLGTYVTADGGAGALKFATYEALKQWVGDKLPEKCSGAALFGCAAAAYVASSVVLIPGELIKQRLQMGMVDSVSGAITSIWKSEGIKGFFAGSSGVWIRDIPYTMLELGIYDNVKTLCLKMRNDRASPGETSTGASQMDEIVAAAISGGITGYCTNPLDLVKTKMMLNPSAFKGFADAFRKTVSDGGVGSLFNGAGARVSYIMPFCTFYLPVYEIIKRKLETCSLSTIPSIRGGDARARGSFLKNKKKRQIAASKIGRGGAQTNQNHPLRSDKCFISF